ncbi:MAG: DNA-directed RNA polymerase subunit omega [Intestinibacillus sp.]
MLKPSMNELMKRVGNRYLLVNIAAQRARDLSEQAEETGDPLPDKAVKLALDEIAEGKIVYRPGPRVKAETRIMPQRDLSDTLDLDLSDEEEDEPTEREDAAEEDDGDVKDGQDEEEE